MSVGTRWLYVFGSPAGAAVKVGLVLSEKRVMPRLREVSRACGEPELQLLASTPLKDVDHPTAEHVEAAVRLWICRDDQISLAGRVDWISVGPGARPDWQALLDDAVGEVESFRQPKV